MIISATVNALVDAAVVGSSPRRESSPVVVSQQSDAIPQTPTASITPAANIITSTDNDCVADGENSEVFKSIFSWKEAASRKTAVSKWIELLRIKA